MIDPRGILEEFVAAAGGRHQHARGEGSACLDAESARRCYVARQAAKGLCKYCRQNAKPGRQLCEKHLAIARARSKKAAETMRKRAETAEAEVARLRAALNGRADSKETQ